MQQVGYCDGSDYGNFEDWESFLHTVTRPRYSGFRWFSHNGGRFDSNAMFDFIRENHPDWDFSFYCIGSCVANLTLNLPTGIFHFTDSYRLLPKNFHDLSHEFNVEHKKLDPDPTFSSIAYNRNDCLGLYEVLTKLFESYGDMAETVASYALRVYRHHFMIRTLKKTSRIVEDFIRRSYFGGRCEIFRWDAAELNKYDVNSLYPSVMMKPVPVDCLGYTCNLVDGADSIGFYEAEIDYPDCFLPVLPNVIAHRLFFPVGRFFGVFTSIELHEAVSEGAAVKIRHGVLFHCEPIFAEFVQEIYGKRMEAKKRGDAAKVYIYKIIANSLYGKFGQRRLQDCFMLDPGTSRLDPTDPLSPILWPVGPPGTGIVRYERESKAQHILPHISSVITARARLRLRELLTGAGRIWYTDTDSVFTDSSLPTDEIALGAMKLEGAGKFEAYGLKEYRFAGKLALKGVSLMETDPATGKKTYRPEIGERFLRGEEYNYTRRAGMLESLRDGLPTFRTLEAVKQRRPRIEKRARCGNGIDTRPWRAQEIEALL